MLTWDDGVVTKEQGVTNIRALEIGSGKDRAPSPDMAQRLVWLVLVARVVELRRGNVIDDASFAAVAQGLETAQGALLGGGSVAATIAAVEGRAEAVLPAELAGVLALGGAWEEVAAAVPRMAARGQALDILGDLADVRDALLALAEEHVITLMPALLGGRPAQPTTFAHSLGSVVGPLAEAAARLLRAYTRVNRSPLGAGVLAGNVIEVDREALAASLGFDGYVGNTFDAVANVEDLVASVEAIAAAGVPVRRYVDELRLWLRTDSASLRLGDDWVVRPEPGLPHLTVPARLDRLAVALREAEVSVAGAVALLRSFDYAPTGSHADVVLGRLVDVAAQAGAALQESARLFASGLTVNRAWLANRAGRGFTTSGDLAAFLMAEEGLPPSVAATIAGVVIGRTMESGGEVTAITPEAIDSAAILTIGRELKVEPEALGRYLAPRRFLERRGVAGSPAPEQTRAWLADARDRLRADRDWHERERARVDAVLAGLVAVVTEAASQAE